MNTNNTEKKPNLKVLFVLLLSLFTVIGGAVYYFKLRNQSLEENSVTTMAIILDKKQTVDRFLKPKFYTKVSYWVKEQKVTALVNLKEYQFKELQQRDTITINYDANNIRTARFVKYHRDIQD